VSYWEARAAARQAYYDRASAKTLRTVSRAYDRMVNQLHEDVEKIIGNFAFYHDLTRDEAIAMLKQPAPMSVLDDLRQRLDTITNKRMQRAIEARLNAPAYTARINRLQAIRESARVNAVQAADVEATVGQVHLRDVLFEGYQRTMFDVQQYTGLGFGFAGVDSRRMNQILRYNWSGKQFSQRVWANANVTARNLSQALTEAIMQGKTSRQTFDTLIEEANGSRFAANRLLRTETNYISNQATAEAYADAGIERYKYMAVLDGRTSRLCQEKDGQEFLLSEKEVGVNYPPLHPWCRSSVEPVIDGISHAHMKRWARDPVTGEEMKVPRTMTYSEWLEAMQEKHGITTVEQSRKMLLNRSRDMKQYQDYAAIVGKKELPKTLDGFQSIKYNEPEKWRLLKGYVSGVREGELSTLTGFAHYQSVAEEVTETLIGTVTSDGAEIKGFKTHFIDRLIGNYEQKRMGVSVPDARAVLVSEESIIRQHVNSKGEVSRHYRNNVCGVTINPVTGLLIQTNPRK
jgi:SPP1 gp7 family putative phage head morphogenesis protein